jgi:hypothetical protein
VLGEWFPIFQTTSNIDQRGVERLHEALDRGKAQIYTFRYLAWGRAHEPINDDELAGLLKTILSKEGGVGVTIEILPMRFHGRNDKKVSNSLIGAVRDVLSAYTFDKKLSSQGNRDSDLAELVRISLTGNDAIPAATQITQKLATAIMERRVYAFNYPKLLDSLAQAQPRVFLDVFLGGINVETNQSRRMLSYDLVESGNPLNQIADGELLSWCEKDPAVRYPIVASAIQPFTQSAETGKLEWKRVVYAIFENAPDLDLILERLSGAIWPKSWSGSLADILLDRVVLFQELCEHENGKIRAWGKAQYSQLQESIRKQREWEQQRHRERDERFE